MCMNTVIKKNKIEKHLPTVISFFLILLLLLQPFGHMITFKMQQYHIHNEMKQKIDNVVSKNREDLILLKIPETIERNNFAVFQRMHEWEFRYYGYMFDIVKKEIHNDTTWYYCIYDKQETQLLANLDTLLRKKNSVLKFIKIKTQNILNIIFFSNKVDINFKNIIVIYELTSYNFSIITWINTPLTHPPNVCI